jgi:D-threo-aldose 1-dehydrogenase
MKTRHFDRIGNGGITFTELGFGTAPIGNLYRAVSDEDANATLEAAWRTGCRYYDTAPLYGLGLSETRLNPFLRSKKRDDYVLSSKVGRIMRACPPLDPNLRSRCVPPIAEECIFDSGPRYVAVFRLEPR